MISHPTSPIALLCAALAAALLVVAPPAPVQARDCVGFQDAKRRGNLENQDIDEASGLAASRRHPGLLWTHNDSGDSARLFLLDRDGSHAAEVRLEGVEAKDWEDMAVGPCAKDSKRSCVYVADIGDNRAERKRVVIYRFPEPDLPEKRPATIVVKRVSALWFTYPAGPRDAETLMVHPDTAKLYVVEKTAARDAGVYRIPRTKTAKKSPELAVEVGQLRFGAKSGFGKMLTGGDIAPDGDEFTVRSYLGFYTFCVPDGRDFEAAVQESPTLSPSPFMTQAEAVAYSLEGDALWTASENLPAPLYRVERADTTTPEK